MRARPFALVAILALVACDDSSEITDPTPDNIAPAIAFASPAADSMWDADDDGLLDVRITWSDESGVDATTLQLMVLDELGEVADPELLSREWRVEAQTSDGIWIEETIEARLPAGTWSLRASISDSTGTTGSAVSPSYTLPHLALHTSVPVGDGGYTLYYCAAREELYVTGSWISVIDARTLALREVELPNSEYVWAVNCSGDGPLMVTRPYLQVFDADALELGPKVALGFSEAWAVGPADDGRFIVSAFFPDGGKIFRFDAETGEADRVQSFGPNVPFDLALRENDLFVGSWPTGLSVQRDWTGEGGDFVPIDGPYGEFVDLEMWSGYAVTTGNSDDAGSIVWTGAATGNEVYSFPFENVHFADVAVSPDGRMFVVTTRVCDGSLCQLERPYLILREDCDANCRRRVELPEGVTYTQHNDQAAFRADGTFLFWYPRVAATSEVYVYLHRP